MLRFEKNDRSKSIGIHLRKKTRLWTRELVCAAGMAIAFHFSAILLFRIKSIPFEILAPTPKIVVTAEKSQSGRPIDFSLSESLVKELNPPPRPALPPLASLHLKPKLPITLDLPKKTLHSAYVRGPFPEEIPFNYSESHTDSARLSIRSDHEGKIFWYEWLDPPSHKGFKAYLESWLGQIRLKPENALQAILIEVHLSP